MKSIFSSSAFLKYIVAGITDECSNTVAGIGDSFTNESNGSKLSLRLMFLVIAIEQIYLGAYEVQDSKIKSSPFFAQLKTDLLEYFECLRAKEAHNTILASAPEESMDDETWRIDEIYLLDYLIDQLRSRIVTIFGKILSSYGYLIDPNFVIQYFKLTDLPE